MPFGSFMKDVAKAAVRGASSGGGMLSAPFRAAQTGVGTVSNINQGLKQFRKKQAQPPKPAKPYRKKQAQPPKIK